jgi:superfamily II RNA helicase
VVLASTLHRVVPLTHYSFVAVPETALKKLDKATEQMVRNNTKELTPLLLPDGVFQEPGYHKLSKVLSHFSTPPPRKFVLNQLFLQLRTQDMLPAICFVFSRKQVELCAQEITVPLLEDDSKVGYTAARECEHVLRKLPNFSEYMQTDDFRLVVKLLEKGIGIHHSGMIPVLRELVELMISKKAIKVLFATESFAIGLDCPIKTAVFTSVTKFDGQHERLLYAHEYTQMAGRAGRRGIDTVGHVVHCNNLFFPSVSDYRDLLSGTPQRLVSKFTISYHLVLRLLTNASHLTLDECCVFANLSMRRQECDAAMEGIQHALVAKRSESDALLATLQCPLETCQTYLTLAKTLQTSFNRKRKAVERDMRVIVDQYPSCAQDAACVAKWNALQTDLRHLDERGNVLQYEMQQQMRRVCDIMIQTGFLDRDGEGKYYLYCPTGTMAAGLAEVHPLVMTDLLLGWSWFRDLDVEQIAAVFSCFVEIKNNDRIMCADDAVEACAQDIRRTMRRYELLDDLPLEGHYSLLDWVLRWTCECHDEAECRVFLHELRATLGVSAGDFAKAMLKIATIGKEVAAIAESHCELECCHKLAQLEKAVLKYVATSQSLYV